MEGRRRRRKIKGVLRSEGPARWDGKWEPHGPSLHAVGYEGQRPTWPPITRKHTVEHGCACPRMLTVVPRMRVVVWALQLPAGRVLKRMG